jgi:hypothetical protein
MPTPECSRPRSLKSSSRLLLGVLFLGAACGPGHAQDAAAHEEPAGSAPAATTGTTVTEGTGATSGDGQTGGWRLATEASPYLRQHADNPVDWHAWGAEAFELARTLDRPVFLSIG